MNIKPIASQIAGALLLALALSACQATASAPAPTAAAAALPSPSTPPTTQPTQAAPTAAATALPVPTAQPTLVLAPTAQPSPTPVVEVLMPNDVPWVLSAGKIFGDDETVDFQKRGLPIPAYQLRAAPDGSAIAYTSEDGKLALIDMRSGANIIRPEEAIHDPTDFVFSPAGRELAFTLLDGDSWRLHVRDLQSGATRVLTEGTTVSQSGAALSLLASPIAWTQAGLLVQHLLWRSDAPPSELTLLNPADGSAQSLRQGTHVAIYPAPDGKRIAIVSGSTPLGATPTLTLTTLDITTGAESVIVPSQQALIRTIRWSPDSSKLLYAASPDFQTALTSIHALNADGSNEQVIEVGGAGVKQTFSDIAWRDNDTLLLLSPEASGLLKLYALPLASFDIAGLQLLMGIPHQPSQQLDRILYVPR